MRQVVAKIAPPPRMTVAQWAESFRYLAPEASALPGKYSLAVTPYLRGILEALTDPAVRKLVCQKSAQVGWTDGVINNFVGYTMDLSPAPVGIMFPRDQGAKDFNVEKLIPMIEATPRLSEKVNVKTRSLQNTQNRKTFPGGFVKMFGSNSTGGVKSTPFRVVIVEEPDDCNLNIKGQGDSIKLAEERVKTFHDSKILAGGTPTIKGVSSIESEMRVSDQRRYLVPCHDCGQAHALEWANVSWLEDAELVHEVYGKARPETAVYSCPHCGSVWNDATRVRNVRRAETAGFGWTAGAPFTGVAGFYLNELYSAFPDSRHERLVRKYLAAVHEANQGETGALIAFWNSSLGLAYEYQSDTPDADWLRARAEDYAVGTVPMGGLILTAGVDVQHDRVAYVVRAWGRGEESWLVAFGELHGATVVPGMGAWVDLTELLGRQWPHESGAQLRVRAASIDSSDGQTADAVYAFVRDGRRFGAMAVKGASESTDDRREIFAAPKVSVDLDRKQKAWKYGLRPFMVGTTRAKDLILGGDGGGRVKLTGAGPGRMHWPSGVRPDYWEQLTSEVKAPHRTLRHRKVWQKKSGVRNEGLDCEVYALHAARSLKVNLLREAQWALIEGAIRQQELLAAPFEPIEANDEEAPAQLRPAPVIPPRRPAPARQSMPGRRVSLRDR